MGTIVSEDDEIRGILLIIAKKLNNYHKVLSDIEYENFVNNISSYSYEGLFKYACIFLDCALTNKGAFLILRKDFENINRLLMNSLVVKESNYVSQISILKDYLKSKSINSFMDNSFVGHIIFSNVYYTNIRLFVPYNNLESVLMFLSGIGARIIERVEKTGDFPYAGVAVFNDSLIEFNIYGYSFKDNIYRVKNNSFNKRIIVENEISNDLLRLMYSRLSDSFWIEKPEFSYYCAITSGTLISFVQAMALKDKVDFRKVKEIKEKMKYNIVGFEEVKIDGLQKTC